jgi:hypothetical protein
MFAGIADDRYCANVTLFVVNIATNELCVDEAPNNCLFALASVKHIVETDNNRDAEWVDYCVRLVVMRAAPND